jgi:hypothetical protein
LTGSQVGHRRTPRAREAPWSDSRSVIETSLLETWTAIDRDAARIHPWSAIDSRARCASRKPRTICPAKSWIRAKIGPGHAGLTGTKMRSSHAGLAGTKIWPGHAGLLARTWSIHVGIQTAARAGSDRVAAECGPSRRVLNARGVHAVKRRPE